MTVFATALSAASPQFESDVAPILRQHCLQCHGLEATMAGLDLRTPPLIFRGGDNGPVIEPGNADESRLVARIADGSMPPGDALKLTPEQLETIRAWVAAGAPAAREYAPTAAAPRAAVRAEDRRHWAFEKLSRPAVPRVRHKQRVRRPVDAFLLEKLESKGLTFADDAGRLTFLRRVCLDLTGLPPSPRQLDQFLADERPGAAERLVDRLLASPHFGERWARHWLDLAGYVDTFGREVQAAAFKVGEGKYRYRDYVVQSFNEDKPYDRFLIEQLAGDELVDWRNAEEFDDETRSLLIATGFLRTAEDPTDSPERDIALHRYAVLHDTMSMFTSNVLGLTVGCAQCHSHKFEPIPQRDYYALMANFTPAYNPQDWRIPQKRILADAAPARKKRIDDHNEKLDEERAPLDRQVTELLEPYRTGVLEEKLAGVPEEILSDTVRALLTPARDRSEVQKYLAGKFGKRGKLDEQQVRSALSASDAAALADLEKQIEAIESRRLKYGEMHVLHDVGPSARTYLLQGGSFESPGAPVEPGVLSVLDDPENPYRIPEPEPGAATSGRRLALARWLTEPDSRAGALVARVFVNRVWEHLFGRGLAPASDNLGKSGDPPTHPELLEWLASEFVDSGWRVKPLIRAIVLSSAYRQSSHRAPDELKRAQAADPGNELLWRMRLRRLEAEIVRDSLLAVSGALNPEIGGPPVMIDVQPSGMVTLAHEELEDPSQQNRRSLYVVARRNNNLTLMSVFDHPVMRTNCTRRDSSAVVLQSLTMLNDRFVLEQSRRFAERVWEYAGPELERQVETAYQLALARTPNKREARWSREFLEKSSAGDPRARLAALGHVLFNSSEFLYVE